MGLKDLFETVLVEHGSSIVQGKHIDLFKTRLIEVEKENSKLQKENARLVEENANLLRQVEAYRASEKYLEVSGAAFKMESEGRYSETAVCPVCHIPLAHSIMGDSLRCTKCGLRPPIRKSQIPKIIPEINGV